MADETAPVQPPVTFGRVPASYRHWKIEVDGPVATLFMAVQPDAGLRDDYDLKLNSYDLGVDIELYDAAQRLRFEHPEVRAVVVTGGLDKVFCAGANIQMLAGSSHHHKVNFCKFTNETRNAIEDASEHSGQVWLAAINGTAAGGGYELALACDEIILIDDRASAVSLPEVPLLGVLPGTGGLTRVVDKRGVRRDLADVFATRTEGVQGAQALQWGLVDSLASRSNFDAHVRSRAEARAASSDRPAGAAGITLTPLDRTERPDGFAYRHVDVAIDRGTHAATITITVPGPPQAGSTEEIAAAGEGLWALAACRELDETILHLRFNEPEIGTWVLRTEGEPGDALAWDTLLRDHAGDWLVREIRLFWRRTFKRLDVSARTLITLVEPGTCFAGTLAELVLAADRSFMLDGTFEHDDRPAATITLTDANGASSAPSGAERARRADPGWYPMSNGLTRLESRFWGHPDLVEAAGAAAGAPLLAADADKLGLVTFTPDDIDWEDEVRLALEERASFSPDALTGMEANYRFVGPETMETKIFGRLTAWQNWIFQRPNASGPEGALRRFGTGSRPAYDRRRI